MTANVKPVKTNTFVEQTTSAGVTHSREEVCFQITSINTQVEVCVQLLGDVLTVLDDGAVGRQLLLLVSPDQ